MNPLSLLTKGHTIRGLKERSTAYKLPEGKMLPDFSSPKKAAPTTTHPPCDPVQTALFEQPQPVAEKAAKSAEASAEEVAKLSAQPDPAVADRRYSGAEEPAKVSSQTDPAVADRSYSSKLAAEPATAAKIVAAEAPAVSSSPASSFGKSPAKVDGPGLWRGATGKVRSLVRLVFGRRKATPFGRPTVQTELALEKVTVVRNNLSEDDMEVVSGGKAGGKPARAGVAREKQTANK